jgi:hypothetical protein
MTAIADVKAASAAQVVACTAVLDAVGSASGDVPIEKVKAASATLKAAEAVTAALPNS